MAIVCYLSDPDFEPEGLGCLDDGYVIHLMGRVVDIRSLSIAWRMVASPFTKPYGYWVVGTMASNSQPVLYLFPDATNVPVYQRLGLA